MKSIKSHQNDFFQAVSSLDLGFLFFTTICFMTVHEKLQNLTTLPITVQKILQKNPEEAH